MPSGGGGSTTSTVNQSNLPAYARPYYEALMDRGLTESERDYTPYGGDRIANQSAATKAGLGMAGNFAQSGTPGYTQAGNIFQNAAQQANQLAGYKSNAITNGYTGPQQGAYQGSNYAAQQMGFGQGGLDRVGTTEFSQAAADKYMSPYMKNVIEASQADAVQNAEEQRAQRNLQAARAGSFGGSRGAVTNAIADRELQKNLSNMSVVGQQQAFEQAMSQFNADQGRALQAATQNQNTALQFGQSNQAAGLDAAKLNEQSRQYGYGATEQAYQTAAQLGLDAQKASEQFRQSGTELGMKGIDLAAQQGKNLQNLQQSTDQAVLDRIKAQLGVGQTQEEYSQAELDQQYNDFVNQRDSERQNLQFLSSLLQGVPVSANQDVTTSGSQNNLSGLLGSVGGLQALYQLGQK